MNVNKRPITTCTCFKVLLIHTNKRLLEIRFQTKAIRLINIHNNKKSELIKNRGKAYFVLTKLMNNSLFAHNL